jgi:hypothetical protein
MVVGRAVEYSLIAFGLLFGISLMVAVMIKAIYWVVHRSGKTKPNEGKEA